MDINRQNINPFMPSGLFYRNSLGLSISSSRVPVFVPYFLSLPSFKEGYLSVSGERMCTILVNRLED